MAPRCSVLSIVLLLAACRDAPTPPTPPPTAPTGASTILARSPAGPALAAGVVPLALDGTKPRLARASGRITGTPSEIIARVAPAYGATTLPALAVRGEIATGGGTRVVRVAQTVDGMPIAGGELRLLLDAGGALVALAGTVRNPDNHGPATYAPALALEANAVARALAYTYAGAPVTAQRSRAQRVWHVTDDDLLVAAWLVETFVGTSDAWRTVIAGDDGRILAQRSLVEDERYRVYAEPDGTPLDGPLADGNPHPAGTPNNQLPGFAAQRDVDVVSPDPWLPPNANVTAGNNVDAYCDLTGGDGLSPPGDFRANATGNGEFLYPYDHDAEPLASMAQQSASIVALFYTINYLHDFWYEAGFTEVAGNAQLSNLGRGGEEGDVLLAEAQDSATDGARNNANMATPGDGMSPRMQVYLWSGRDEVRLDVAGRTPPSNGADFGPRDYDLLGAVTAAFDGIGTTTDACDPITNNVTGLIALVDRGNCTYRKKIENAQLAGAIGVIVANNAGTGAPSLGNDATLTTPITIPAMSVAMAEGAQIRVDLAAGPVTATLHRIVGTEGDGSLDASVVAHEYGHYLHHRLSECNTRLCSAMSEGWADFLAMMLAVRAGDDLDGTYALGQYATRGTSSDPAYFGIRRAPYSVDPSRNALTFRHMGAGEPLPTSHPFDGGGANNEVHNAGEIWAQMLFEGYVALHAARGSTPFATVRANMARYIVAGLLMAPPDGTPTEVRDGILLATKAIAPSDAALLAEAFARRGFGSCAESPPRNSTGFQGIVESYTVSGFSDVGDIALAQDAGACDDDAILDVAEAGRISTTIANHGFAELFGITATLSTTTPGLAIANPTVTIASLVPGAELPLSFAITYDGERNVAVAGEVTLHVTSTGGCGDVTRTIPLRLGVDDVPAASAADSFDAGTSVWMPTTANWKLLRETALDGAWHGDDSSAFSDTQLVSPQLFVSSTDPFVVAFSHRFQYEFSDATYFDGSVIEYTTDSGQSWIDVATLASVPYNATIGGSSNIEGRQAFGDTNPAYPAFDQVSLDFGTQLAGQIVQLRFRIATDPAVGGEGWDVDDLAVSGITNTPFPTQVPDPGVCGVGPGPDAGVEPAPDGGGEPLGAGGCCSTSDLGSGEIGLSIIVLSVLARRRRRIAAVRGPWQGPAL